VLNPKVRKIRGPNKDSINESFGILYEKELYYLQRIPNTGIRTKNKLMVIPFEKALGAAASNRPTVPAPHNNR
jgi:hypothetical protein